MKIIDVNAGVGFWPIQRFTDRTLAELNETYERLAVDRVWVSAIESILYPEPDAHDLPLFDRLEQFPRFAPVKTVNPLLGNWQKSLHAAADRWPLAALKLFPSYHDYSLQHDAMAEVCAAARELALPILVQVRVNDERNQPACMQVAGVPDRSIADLAIAFPDNVVIALAPYGCELKTLATGGDNLLVDISFIDQSEAITAFADEFPTERMVFGSMAPFCHVDSAYLKLTHFELPQAARETLASGALLKRLPGRSLCAR